ncbi:plasmid mobilization relaxosome protein MobC [Enterovibrio paralichthyis]|uniref:plasmid mobilization relaxosome protein MobC n=1 Tax=Enterovibrio paralichthyis TaxID=2853805 RepID=UPI001C496D82|nr:plasmid mobilization relaxosome protein MobC [Enterovibrio paralichthyis]MBV7300735.1 plasmid mobilization relaxosome protein MobC [Enterovibrio paralichthyis]
MEQKNQRRTYRLGEVEALFDDAYSQAREQNPTLKESAFLRWCIRQALTESGQAISPERAKEAVEVLNGMKRELAKIGGNFNQVAHYFNIHDHLVESELRANHLDIQRTLKTTTKTIEGLINELRRSIY